MATYEIETDDGSVYQIDTEEPTVQQPQQSKTGMQVAGDVGQTLLSPMVSKENIMGNAISKGIAGAMPFTAMGGMVLPPPLGNILPPNLKASGNAEEISAQTSPLAIIGNIGILKGLQAQKVLPKLFNLGGRKTAQTIAESADKGFDTVGKIMSNKYDMLFDRIKTGKISNSEVFASLGNVVESYPEAAGVPKMKKIMERLANTPNISAKELHELKQVVRKSIPQGVWSGRVEADAMQNAIRDVYFTITDSLEKLGGKEYTGLSQEFRKVKEAEKLAKKMFYKSGVPSNEPVGGKLDIPTEKAVKQLSSMLPQGEQFSKDFMSWRRGQGLKKNLGKAGVVGTGAYLLHRYLADKLGMGGSR